MKIITTNNKCRRRERSQAGAASRGGGCPLVALVLVSVGVKLSVTRDAYKGHARSPWLVVVPRRLSASGKRIYRRFRTKAEAHEFAAKLRGQATEYGEHPYSSILTRAETCDASQAASILEPLGINLLQCAQIMSRLAELHGSVANAIVFNEEKGSARNASSAPPPHETLSLRTAFEAMNEAKRHQSPYTLRSRTSRFAHFFRENPGIEATPLSELSTAQISVALNRACHSPTVFNDTLGALSALYAYAMRKGWCTSNPLIPIDRRHVTEKEIHPLMPVDLRRLFAACRPPYSSGAQTHFARHKPRKPSCRHVRSRSACRSRGVRRHPSYRMLPPEMAGHLSRRERRHSPPRQQQNRRRAPCRAAPHTCALAPEPPAAQPSDLILPPPHVLIRKTQALHLRAGFSSARPWPPDALRHSYATWYLKNGGTINQLQLNMGHSSSGRATLT